MSSSRSASARWRVVVERLGGARLGARPTTVWATQAGICATLTELVRWAPDNALLFPSGDHLALTSATPARDAGCLELHCGGDVTSARAVSLTLERLTPDPDAALAYFRLETAPFDAHDPRTTYARTSGRHPPGAEPSPGAFGGAFLVLSASSPYLASSDVIAALHNSLRPKQFRDVLGTLALRLATTVEGELVPT